MVKGKLRKMAKDQDRYAFPRISDKEVDRRNVAYRKSLPGKPMPRKESMLRPGVFRTELAKSKRLEEVDALEERRAEAKRKTTPGYKFKQAIDKGYWKRLRAVPKVQRIRRDENLPRVMQKKRKLYFRR